jgi:hypothetical protein
MVPCSPRFRLLSRVEANGTAYARDVISPADNPSETPVLLNLVTAPCAAKAPAWNYSRHWTVVKEAPQVRAGGQTDRRSSRRRRR